MAQERRINLRFPPEKFDELDEKRFRAKTTFQDIGVQLFEEWLTGKHPDPAPRLPKQPADPLVEMLGVIRASGDAQLLGIVKKAIEASYGLLEHSLTREDIDHLKAAAAGSDSGMAGRNRGPGFSGTGEPAAGKRGTRKSA